MAESTGPEMGEIQEKKSMHEEELNVKLEANPGLQGLVRYLSHESVNWEKYFQEYLNTYTNRNDIKRMNIGDPAEIALRRMLTNISTSPEGSHTEPISIQFPHFPVETENYRFVVDPEKNPHGGVLVTKKNGEHITDHDIICVVDGLPTLIEVKMVNQANSRTFNTAVRNSHINNKFRALHELFSGIDSFGYVVAAPQNVISPKTEPKQYKLVQNGGLFLPLRVGDNTKYQLGVMKYHDQYKFGLKGKGQQFKS